LSIAQTTESTAHLRCIACGATPASAAQDFRCTNCGDLLEFTFPEWSHDPQSLKSLWANRKTILKPLDQSGVWRFREMLPNIPEERAITLREGNTPLYDLPRCARFAGLDALQAKHQGMNPTASFKDTGMTVAASSANADGFRWVACASTGNTSASMAAYAARGNMRSLVLIPEGKISWGKLSQSLDYGALTCQLRTDFDGCVRILNELVRRKPVYLLNSVNPYRIEGQKTAAIELMEQLNWQPPDHIIVPGGNLGNSSAIGKALLEMHELKLIDRLPKLSIIQAEGANPFYRSVKEYNGNRLVPMTADTQATAIRIGNPASWKKALRVLREFVEGPGYGHVSARTKDLAFQLLSRLFAMCGDKSRVQNPRSKVRTQQASGSRKNPQRLSDPDRVVTRLDNFISAYGARGTLFELWNSNPAIFELLVLLFDRSEFLAELAIRTPDLVDELVTSGRLRQRKSVEETLRDLRHGLQDTDQHRWIRRYHQAELMRIGLRDILGLADFEQYLAELSALADASLQYAQTDSNTRRWPSLAWASWADEKSIMARIWTLFS